MARTSTPRSSRSRNSAPKASAGNAIVPGVALQKSPPSGVDAGAVSLRDEVMRQAALGFQQLSAEIVAERRERQQFQRVLTIGLAAIGTLVVLATIVLLSSIGSSVRDTLAYEMSEMTSTTARTIREGTEPVQQTVERQSEMMTKAAELERVLVSLYGYEHLAMSGSRQAFVELRRLANRKDDAGLIARDRIAQITARYAVLSAPQRGNIRVGEWSIVRGDSSVRLADLTSAELVFVIGSPDASLSQVHQVMSILWDRPMDTALERELWSLLQRSNNLPAAVAISSLLKKNFGTRATMYDFDAWRSFLAKRL